MVKYYCSLCNYETSYILTFRNKDYFECPNCESIQMHPDSFISLEKEKHRYELHNNDVFDLGYRNFVKPILDYIFNNFNINDLGLDFGAGHGPVIAKILEDKNFDIKIYDPFFHNNKALLKSKYDYIIICEVIEHFHKPKQEFELLYNLLNPNGQLIIMTDPLLDNTEFSKWYYKNDETHVFFYSLKTFEYIQKEFKFSNFTIDNRLIVFTK